MTDETPATPFAVKVHQNPYLAVGERTLHAVVGVEASGAAGGLAHGEPLTRAEVVIIDTSASMSAEKRLDKAREAAAVAVDTLVEGTEFAVIAGSDEATQVYPRQGLARASERTRQEARRALRDVRAAGSTSMSTWLSLADSLLAGSAARKKHAVLLTDGHNTEGERPLAAALKACEGRFDCDCRGIGTDWSPRQVATITHALNGAWQPVASPQLLAEDFRALTAASMAKHTAGVELHVAPGLTTRIVSFGQVRPVVEDLTDRGSPVGEGVTRYPLGSWGVESREYVLELEVDQSVYRIENESRAGAALLKLVAAGSGEPVLSRAHRVFAIWTSDFRKSGPIDAKVAEALGQQELQHAVSTALALLDEPADDAEAREKFGRAVALAYKAGQHGLIEHLSHIVDIVDPLLGDVRMRPREEINRLDRIWSAHLSSQASPGRSARAIREADGDR
ncbi:VWA domain-containing protein [Streptantibioticus silvisoli]|uniref:VWA domain-containing protein n=1 Tax=Streptantibioticus silvisoli TaxID=2705255 RepID=A0ABT6VY00_9ACTN|nr:vWA domain-containing protein [Streptantibioticus silvisoli]MDI5963367.1 vWA domain-containing protein [Streptantibioticus silvisoli]